MNPYRTVLLLVGVLLTVAVLSFPAIPQSIKEVVVTNAVPVVGSSNPTAAPVSVAMAASNIISLRTEPGSSVTLCGDKRAFRQIFPDGSFSSETFVVPAGKVLVVTSLQWTDDSLTPNSVNIAFLARQNQSVPQWGLNGAVSSAMSDAAGAAGGNMTMPNGFAVSSGTLLCLGNLLGTPTIRGYAQGYLADAG